MLSIRQIIQVGNFLFFFLLFKAETCMSKSSFEWIENRNEQLGNTNGNNLYI